jgi:hypothetical protein
MIRGILFGFVFLYSFSAFSALTVSECTFRKKDFPKTLAQAKEKYNFILTGSVNSSGFTEIKKNFKVAELKVSTVWQGKVDSSFKIREDKCTELKPGQEYLIFARMGGDDSLDNYHPFPLAEAGHLISQLGDGWPTDLSAKSVYPNTDERLKCPVGTTYARYLAIDKTRTYSCETPGDKSAAKPMIAIFDNGKIKEQGATKNYAPIGEWKYFDRDGTLKATKQFDENGNEVCDDTRSVPENHTVIAYLKNKSVYPLMAWDGKELKKIKEQNIRNVKSFVSVYQKDPVTFAQQPPHRDAHSGECVYSGSLLTDVGEPSLVTSKKFDFIVPIPQAARDLFNAIRGPCVRHGDTEPETCLFRELLAVTDLNKNGKWEFWFKQPYLWDIGVSIAEVSADQKSLIPVASDCSDCSD